MPTVRKIFTICIIKRTWGKLKNQVAYQKEKKYNRTSYMCVKFMIEKTIASKNYNFIIMIIHMSKVFDTVNRKTLLKKLETILDESEMRMMYLLIINVKLNVRVGRSLGEEIVTNIGIAQGECLSALLFSYSIRLNLWMHYLAYQ